MVIIRMEEVHIPEVLAIEEEAFTTPWTREAFLKEIRDNRYARYYVALSEGMVTGYVGIWIVLDELHITNLAVHQSYRRKGLARQLLQVVYDLARKKEIRLLTLEVRESNFEARNLYEREGFTMVGIRPGYYQDNHEDAILMVLHLQKEGGDGHGDKNPYSRY